MDLGHSFHRTKGVNRELNANQKNKKKSAFDILSSAIGSLGFGRKSHKSLQEDDEEEEDEDLGLEDELDKLVNRVKSMTVAPSGHSIIIRGMREGGLNPDIDDLLEATLEEEDESSWANHAWVRKIAAKAEGPTSSNGSAGPASAGRPLATTSAGAGAGAGGRKAAASGSTHAGQSPLSSGSRGGPGGAATGALPPRRAATTTQLDHDPPVSLVQRPTLSQSGGHSFSGTLPQLNGSFTTAGPSPLRYGSHVTDGPGPSPLRSGAASSGSLPTMARRSHAPSLTAVPDGASDEDDSSYPPLSPSTYAAGSSGHAGAMSQLAQVRARHVNSLSGLPGTLGAAASDLAISSSPDIGCTLKTQPKHGRRSLIGGAGSAGFEKGLAEGPLGKIMAANGSLGGSSPPSAASAGPGSVSVGGRVPVAGRRAPKA
uniref:Uncharacterized protein n=1 Tax=Chlamydomonas leiostraca TaxID=1034604 RepID=A0A7S0RCP2_9CHLO|mmetsp:Transcript_19201/g.48842  ORF Transcript_19201/g.48842 Transcript_19201/m.48842 type:complete len:428 (+) Transcript_19201:158-1441(+)